MLVVYRLIGILYIVSGCWCAFRLDLAADFLGVQCYSEGGRAEFFAVYCGLQVGLGLAFLLSSFKSVYLEASMYFSAIFSSLLALFRLVSLFVFGFIGSLVVMFVLEVLIASFLWFFWFKTKQLNR